MKPREIVDGGAHGTVEGRGGEHIAVWEYAPPRPQKPVTPATVVFAHGWTLAHTVWIPFIELIQAAHNVRVLAYDQPGHGRSTLGSDYRPTIKSLGESLADVLDAEVPEGPVVLVGHSMGGMTIMAYAGAHPEEIGERVRGVLLSGTSAGDITRRFRSVESVVMRVIHRGPMIPTGNFITQRGQRHSLFGDRCKPEDLAFTVKVMASTPLPTLSRYYLALMDHDETENLGHLSRTSTVVMVGEKDRLTSTRHARGLHAAVPGSRLVIVPGAGHMLMFEAPELLAIELSSLILGARPR
ncbi:MAG: alpha/beta fold hydrolase [Dermatophilaceae bacterium]|nr:alpha/beta hydrolase [Intrasporangiaceae bacterium]